MCFCVRERERERGEGGERKIKEGQMANYITTNFL